MRWYGQLSQKLLLRNISRIICHNDIQFWQYQFTQSKEPASKISKPEHCFLNRSSTREATRI